MWGQWGDRGYRGVSGLCGTPLSYDQGLAEDLDASSGPLCSLLISLTRPPSRLYVRVNTLKIDVERYLNILGERGLEFKVDEDIPEALWHPVEGPFKIELTGDEKVVVADKIAAESVLMGSDLYAPGVIEAKGVERGDRVVIVSPNGIVVGAGVAVESWRNIRVKRKGLAVKVTDPIYKAPRVRELPGFKEGLIYGQSITSMYVARAANLRPGETLIDMTAAPGGKVSHAAQLMGRRSTIIAVDRASKIGILRENLARLGIDWVKVVASDSRRLTRIYPSLMGKADVVLVDPPCSNIGVVPKVWDKKGMKDVISASRYQRGFISEAKRLLKRGGRLVYSTCTLTSIENEFNAAYAVEEGFELEWSWGVKPSRGWSSGLGWRWAPHRDGTPGFFLAVLVKVR